MHELVHSATLTVLCFQRGLGSVKARLHVPVMTGRRWRWQRPFKHTAFLTARAICGDVAAGDESGMSFHYWSTSLIMCFTEKAESETWKENTPHRLQRSHEVCRHRGHESREKEQPQKSVSYEHTRIRHRRLFFFFTNLNVVYLVINQNSVFRTTSTSLLQGPGEGAMNIFGIQLDWLF